MKFWSWVIAGSSRACVQLQPSVGVGFIPIALIFCLKDVGACFAAAQLAGVAVLPLPHARTCTPWLARGSDARPTYMLSGGATCNNVIQSSKASSGRIADLIL